MLRPAQHAAALVLTLLCASGVLYAAYQPLPSDGVPREDVFVDMHWGRWGSETRVRLDMTGQLTLQKGKYGKFEQWESELDSETTWGLFDDLVRMNFFELGKLYPSSGEHLMENSSGNIAVYRQGLLDGGMTTVSFTFGPRFI